MTSPHERTVATFHVDGDPVPKARARVGNGHGYTPARTEAAQAHVRWAWHKGAPRTWRPVKGARYGAHIEFRTRTLRRVDVDNLAKLVLDALNGLAWVDDAQVVELRATKQLDRQSPGSTVTVWRFPDPEPTETAKRPPRRSRAKVAPEVTESR